MLHDLHFVVNSKDFEWIFKKAKELDESLSGVVKIMIFYMMPFVDLNWLKSKSRKCKYKVLDDKPKERFHIHCYVSEEVYKKFKTIHKDLDFYTEYSIEFQIMEREKNAEIDRKVTNALQHLSSKQKEVIYLRFNESLGYNEIASILDINIESVRKQVHRALKTVREIIGNELITALFVVFIKK